MTVGDVDARNTCHNASPLLTLTLLVPGISTNDAYHALALDHFAFAADFFDRCHYFHDSPRNTLFGAEDDTGAGQVIRRKFNRDLISGEDTDVVHPHLAGDVSENHVTVFELDPKRRVRQVLDHLALHLNNVFLAHQTSINLDG